MGVVGNAWCVQASYRHYVIQRHLTSLDYFRPIVAHSLLFIVQFTYLLFIFTVNNTTSKCMYIFTYRTCYESASFKRNGAGVTRCLHCFCIKEIETTIYFCNKCH